MEIAPGRTISTVGYNGTVPGPLVRFREGVTATVDLFNDTDDSGVCPLARLRRSDQCGWRRGGGQPRGAGAWPPSLPAGAPAFGLPVRAHARHVDVGSEPRHVHRASLRLRISNRNATRAGTIRRSFWRRTNGILPDHPWRNRKTAVRPTPDAGAPRKETRSRTDGRSTTGTLRSTAGVWATASRFASRRARRVLFHFLNASATDSVRFALPGHRFQVVALDGNPVPHPQLVDVLELGTAERIDAVVTMDSPGIWILGTPMDRHREKGMGIVVEYANRSGKPTLGEAARPLLGLHDLRRKPRRFRSPDEVIPLVIGHISGGKGSVRPVDDQWQGLRCPRPSRRG